MVRRDVLPLVLEIAEDHVNSIWYVPIIQRPGTATFPMSARGATDLPYTTRALYQLACVGMRGKMHLQLMVVLVAHALSDTPREDMCFNENHADIIR